MKDETQVKDEIILVVKEAIRDNTTLAAVDWEPAELDSNDVDHIAEEVADRLYADGWRKYGLICKVGDTVYQTDTDGERIYKSTVKRIIFDTGNIAFTETAIGTSVFLSEEELAERQKILRGEK